MALDQSTSIPRAAAPAREKTARRSTAMWLLPLSAAIELVLLLDVLRQNFIPPVLVSAVVMTAVLAAVLLRPGRWAYLFGAIGFVFLTAGNGPIIIDGIVHPLTTDHQWKEAVAMIVSVTGLVAGVAAFVEARRGAAVTPALVAPLGEALAMMVAGAIVGATVIGLTAYAQAQASPGAGVANAVVEAPAQPPVALTASGTRFLNRDLKLQAGSGTVYVVNQDATAHTFDIDLGAKHYSWPVPAKSTVAVVLPLTAGRYTFYCAIPGHRGAGMEGTLTVQ